MIGSTKGKIMSIENLTIFAIYRGEEKHGRTVFASVAAEINALKEITINSKEGVAKTMPIISYYIGDYKSEKLFAGVLGDNSNNFPCIYCEHPKETSYGSFSSYSPAPIRSLEIDKEHGKNDACLFLSSHEFVPPFFHIVMGMGTRLLNLLVRIALEHDYKNLSEPEMEKLLSKYEHAKKYTRKKLSDVDTIKRTENEAEQQIFILEDIVNALTTSVFSTPDRASFDLAEEDPETTCSKYCLNLSHSGVPLRCNSPDWIQCSVCDQWFHTLCIGLSVKEVKVAAKNKFKCPECGNVFSSEKVLEVCQEELGIWKGNQRDLLKSLAVAINAANSESDFAFEGSLLEKVEVSLERVGASRKAYYQDFNGNHLRLILKNASKISSFLPAIPKLKSALYAMELLGRIQSLFEPIILSQEEKDKFAARIEEFGRHLELYFPEESIAQKGHILFRYV